MAPLTKRQKQILDFVRTFIDRNGYAPSVREIADAFGLSSAATVHQHLEALASKGVLQKAPGRSRAVEAALPERPAARIAEVPMLGKIAAGRPIESVAHLDIDNTVEIPESYLGSGDHFALTVRGESMIEEGILDGDTLIVKRRDHALPGQVVVALVDGEATVKKFYPRPNGMVELRPANPGFAPIKAPESSVIIQGVVISLLRRFGGAG